MNEKQEVRCAGARAQAVKEHKCVFSYVGDGSKDRYIEPKCDVCGRKIYSTVLKGFSIETVIKKEDINRK